MSSSFLLRNRGFFSGLFLIPVAVALLFSSPLIQNDAFNLVCRLLGYIFFVAYVTMRLWATLFIGGRKEGELIVEGPYSITRNPLYFGALCFALAVTFFLQSLLVLIATGVLVFYYGVVIAEEERFLEAKFGDRFREYARAAPRFFPRFSSYRAPEAIEVKLKPLRLEARRLWLTAFVPFAAELVNYLRLAPWWPHWLVLP